MNAEAYLRPLDMGHAPLDEDDPGAEFATHTDSQSLPETNTRRKTAK
jgi:hypothetical protein